LAIRERLANEVGHSILEIHISHTIFAGTREKG
jgi:hypothetical protein